ncbi:MAG: thymidine phosphorylase [bacterium]
MKQSKFNTVELIRKKREKTTLANEEIIYLVDNYSKGNIPDYQFSAFLMAAYINGLSKDETSALTKAMLHSGDIVNLSSIKGSKVDKHSTGGVGDKTSLIIAPIAAAAGVYVPMISGRGLGHTGGTLDKLEAIPGFNVNLDLKNYKEVLKKSKMVLIGQTKEIAPADKLIYSLRDVTATVESIPLITGSIMSKKLAEGIDALVLDVKTGSGAFMKTLKDSENLAKSLIDTAKAFDKKVVAFITDMNQPLGKYIGNWFEVLESINILKGEVVPGLTELCLNLAGTMIYLGGKADSIKSGINIAQELINNGKAFDKFVEVVKLQGGDISFILDPDKYPKCKFVEKVKIKNSGYIKAIDTYEIGMLSLLLGAGRLKKEDIIDPLAGIIFYPLIGDNVKEGDVVAELHSNRKITQADKDKLINALTLSSTKPPKVKLIHKILE